MSRNTKIADKAYLLLPAVGRAGVAFPVEYELDWPAVRQQGLMGGHMNNKILGIIVLVLAVGAIAMFSAGDGGEQDSIDEAIEKTRAAASAAVDAVKDRTDDAADDAVEDAADEATEVVEDAAESMADNRANSIEDIADKAEDMAEDRAQESSEMADEARKADADTQNP
jgi:hypothetical protein